VKALVVVSHPDPGSLNHALARSVAAAWGEAGCQVAFRDLHAEGFDPVLTAA
jgi:putative NADPH-quinone reductase